MGIASCCPLASGARCSPHIALPSTRPACAGPPLVRGVVKEGSPLHPFNLTVRTFFTAATQLCLPATELLLALSASLFLQFVYNTALSVSLLVRNVDATILLCPSSYFPIQAHTRSRKWRRAKPDKRNRKYYERQRHVCIDFSKTLLF